MWSKCSKRVFVGPLVVGICLHDAVLTYNDGCCSRLAVIEVLTGRIGKMCVRGLQAIDAERRRVAEYKGKNKNAVPEIDEDIADSEDSSSESEEEYAAGLF